MTKGVGDSDNQINKPLNNHDKKWVEENYEQSLDLRSALRDSNRPIFTEDLDGQVEKKDFEAYFANNYSNISNIDDDVEFMFDYLDKDGDGILNSSELQELKSEDGRSSKSGIIDSYTIAHYFFSRGNKDEIIKEFDDAGLSGYYVEKYDNGEINEEEIAGLLQAGFISAEVAQAVSNHILETQSDKDSEKNAEWNDELETALDQKLSVVDLTNDVVYETVKSSLSEEYEGTALTKAIEKLEESKTAQLEAIETGASEVDESEEIETGASNIEESEDSSSASAEKGLTTTTSTQYFGAQKSINIGEGSVSLNDEDPSVLQDVENEVDEILNNIEIKGSENGYTDINAPVKAHIQSELMSQIDEDTTYGDALNVAANWANDNVIPELVSSVVSYVLTETGFYEKPEGNENGYFHFDNEVRKGVYKAIQNLDTPEAKREAASKWVTENCTPEVVKLGIIYANDLIDGKPVIVVPESELSETENSEPETISEENVQPETAAKESTSEPEIISDAKHLTEKDLTETIPSKVAELQDSGLPKEEIIATIKSLYPNVRTSEITSTINLIYQSE